MHTHFKHHIGETILSCLTLVSAACSIYSLTSMWTRNPRGHSKYIFNESHQDNVYRTTFSVHIAVTLTPEKRYMRKLSTYGSVHARLSAIVYYKKFEAKIQSEAILFETTYPDILIVVNLTDSFTNSWVYFIAIRVLSKNSPPFSLPA